MISKSHVQKSISVRMSPHASTDFAYWVSLDVLDEHFCQADFKNSPTVINPDDVYALQWFRDAPNALELELFEFPLVAFHDRGGELVSDFIGTRHRTAVLFRHLNEIPFFFACDSEGTRRKLEELKLQKVPENEIIRIPDLPRKDLPDEAERLRRQDALE